MGAFEGYSEIKCKFEFEFIIFKVVEVDDDDDDDDEVDDDEVDDEEEELCFDIDFE